MYKQRCRLRKWTIQLWRWSPMVMVSFTFERATAVHNAVAFVPLHFVALVCRFHSCCAPFSMSAHQRSAPPRTRTSYRPARALLATPTKTRNEHETTCPTGTPSTNHAWLDNGSQKRASPPRAWLPYTCETLEGRRQLNRAHRGTET